MTEQATCKDCGKEFEAKPWFKRFCSPLCRLRNHRKAKKDQITKQGSNP